MQEKKIFGFDFIARFLIIFAIAVIFVSVMGALEGDKTAEYSSMYRLGSSGIAFATLFQLGVATFVITVLSSLFFSERIFGKMMVVWRTVLMFFSIIVVIVICIIAFDWFPVDFLPGWIGFFISFGTCFAGSTIISVIKTRADSKRYGELLEHYKQQREADEEASDEER